MENKIWKLAENMDEDVDVVTPYETLDKYASKLMEDTGFIEGNVTETTSDSNDEVIYALYLVVPELKNYSYRLIEVVQPNGFTFYPVTMRLFGNSNGPILEFKDVNEGDFENKLIMFIENNSTQKILKSFKKHVDVVKKYAI